MVRASMVRQDNRTGHRHANDDEHDEHQHDNRLNHHRKHHLDHNRVNDHQQHHNSLNDDWFNNDQQHNHRIDHDSKYDDRFHNNGFHQQHDGGMYRKLRLYVMGCRLRFANRMVLAAGV